MMQEPFRIIKRRNLAQMLLGAAHVSAERDDEYAQHFRNAGIMIANAEVLCVINHDEAFTMRRAWVRTECELRLYRLPPERRRAVLLDPEDGPQRFLTPRRRLQMLREAAT
jgi:hypothetical protein